MLWNINRPIKWRGCQSLMINSKESRYWKVLGGGNKRFVTGRPFHQLEIHFAPFRSNQKSSTLACDRSYGGAKIFEKAQLKSSSSFKLSLKIQKNDHLIQFLPIIKKFWCVCDRSQGGAEILEKRPTKQLIKLNLAPRHKICCRLRQIAEIIHEVGPRFWRNSRLNTSSSLNLAPLVSVIARH